MGSNHSVHSYIQTETPSFNPGGSITGVVNLSVQASTSAKVLNIRLVGKERTRWIREKSTGRKTIEFYTGNHRVIDTSYPIWSFEGTLPQGQYTIPFDIVTPNWLPPSFLYKGFVKKARIYYCIKAVVDDRTKTRTHKNNVWASSYPASNSVPRPISEENTFDVRNFCCFKAGFTHLTATLNRNFALLGEDLSVLAQVDNTQGLKVANRLTCNLVRRIEMRGNTLIMGSSSNKIIEDRLFNVSQHFNIAPGSKSSSEKPIVFSIDLRDVDYIFQYPSMNGVLVKCEYRLDVILNFKNLCGCGSYKVSLPIDIHNGVVISERHIIPPPNLNSEWNPVCLVDTPVKWTLVVPTPHEYCKEIDMTHIEEGKTAHLNNKV